MFGQRASPDIVGRRRRAVRVVCSVLLVGCTCVWLLSGWYQWTLVQTRHVRALVYEGVLECYADFGREHTRITWTLERRINPAWLNDSGFHLEWRPLFAKLSQSGGVVVFVPLWFFVVCLLLLTVWAWWPHRAPPCACRRCGYDLTGNVSGRCPECGSAVPPECGR